MTSFDRPMQSPTDPLLATSNITFETAVAAVFDWLQQADLGQNDRLALELLKLGPLPVTCLSPWVPADLLLTAAQQPTMPAHYRQAYLARLADCHGLEPRLAVVAAQDTPIALLQKLVGELEPEVRALAQQNPSCPAALVTLVEDQWAIASAEDTQPEELTQLAQSCWPWVRQAVASNLAAPADVLQVLAEDPIGAIQLAVAENPAAPDRVLKHLANHPNAKIQVAVANNPNLSEALQLDFLAKMPQHIRQRRDLTLEVLERIYQLEISKSKTPAWKNLELQSILLRNPNTSSALLSKLADHYEPNAVRAFYRQKRPQVNQSKQSEILAKWVKEAADYLAKILEHPNCSLELLEQIAHIDNAKIRLTLLKHAQTPIALLEKIGLELLPADQLRRRRDIHQELVAITQNLRTPKAILEQFVARYCEDPEPSLTFANEMLESHLPDAFKRSIRTFIQRHQSVVHLKNKLRQVPEARTEILQDWITFRTNFSDSDRQTLDSLCQMSMGATGLRGGSPKADAGWAGTRPEAMMLYGFLQLFETESVGSRLQLKGEEAVVAALAWHPSLSETQHQQLRALIPDLNVKSRKQRSQARWREALALNPLAPECDRAPYLQSMLELSDETRRQLAKSPHTPVNLLQQLMLAPNQYLHSQLARNPSLPSAELIKLLPGEYRTVFSNPALQARDTMHWLLDEANSIGTSTKEVKRLLVTNSHWSSAERHRIVLSARQQQQQRQAAAILTQWPARHHKAKQESAKSWHTKPETLNILAQDTDISLRETVAANGKLPAAGQRLLAQDPAMPVLLTLAQRRGYQTEFDPMAAAILFERGDRQVHLALARNKNTPTEVLTSLHQLHDSEITALLLTHSNTSPDILRQEIPLINNEKHLEKVLRGSNNNSINRRIMPVEVLERLASHEKDVIRFLVARHTSASPEILEKLSQDSHKLTRTAVAENPSTPAAVLIAMAQHECQTNGSATNFHSTSQKILKREDTPPEALDWIARNPSRRGNAYVVRHANVSTKTLDWIAANDNDDDTLITLAKNPKTSTDVLAKLAEHESAAVRAAVAAQPNCPSHILPLELLSQHPSLKVCLNIATNPNTPTEYLEMFVTSQKPALRAAVATNLSLTSGHLATLALDPKVEVRLAVSRNPQTPADLQKDLKVLHLPSKTELESPTLRALPQRYDPDRHSDADLPDLLQSYAQSNHAFVRFAALLNPLTPADSLTQAAQSTAWIERYAVAENPALPQDVRQQLQGDNHAWVRAIANGPN